MAWTDIRNGNPLKPRLRGGETLLGCFQRIAAPEVTEVCAAAGFDFVVIDLEHTPMTEERAAGLIRAGEAAGIPALVRVGSHDPAAIGRLLDAGPAGLHVPQVRSASEAEAAVRATRYPPRGSRGLAAPRQAGYGGRMSLADYVRASEEWPLVVVQVESRSGLDEIEAIAAVEGVDVVFIGLTDLSQDLGVPGEYGDLGLRDAVDLAFRAIESCGKAAGVPVTGPAMAEEYVGRGATYLTANDVRLLLESGSALVGKLRGSA
jgi:4-hydroxy-2-oxoheptanedioate aldolase